jgi:hypothetical protein
LTKEGIWVPIIRNHPKKGAHMPSSSIKPSQSFWNRHAVKFICGLLLVTQRKTGPAVAKKISTSSSTVYRILHKQEPFIETFSANVFATIQRSPKKGYFIIDDTVVPKEYSSQMQGTSETYNSATNRPCLGLTIVTLLWTDGSRSIPVAFLLWYNKNVASDTYKTKIQLAQELIDSIPSSISLHAIIFDGLYASKAMLKYLNEKNTHYVARAATNRVIIHNGIKASLKDHTALKLYRNERSKTILAEWHDMLLYFTVEKRKDKNGKFSIVFIVSNFENLPKEYIRLYRLRWPIELFHRTSKQYLGLEHCQSTDLKMQKVRIYNVFYAYIFLQQQKEIEDSPNIETVIRSIQTLGKDDLMALLTCFNTSFVGNN